MTQAETMTQAEAIMYITGNTEAWEVSYTAAIEADAFWTSETTVFVFDDNSSIAFSGSERWLVDTEWRNW